MAKKSPDSIFASVSSNEQTLVRLNVKKADLDPGNRGKTSSDRAFDVVCFHSLRRAGNSAVTLQLLAPL